MLLCGPFSAHDLYPFTYLNSPKGSHLVKFRNPVFNATTFYLNIIQANVNKQMVFIKENRRQDLF